MHRRDFLKRAIAPALILPAATRRALAAAPKLKIKRIRIYDTPKPNLHFNQSNKVVTIETDAGITGIGEGGSKDTVSQCAGFLINEDPLRIDHLWQYMYRGFFYPAGREKLHGLGALDLALWDIKGKALGVPVWELLGGIARDRVECYSTGFPSKGSVGETARACIEAGFRSYRTSVVEAGPDRVYNTRQAVDKTFEQCREIRNAIGPNADWHIDFHTRIDLPDALRLATLLEPLNPFLIEDPVRSENKAVLKAYRSHIKIPLAVGEQFGDRWDIRELIEDNTIDYSRVTLPNSGGITEFMKIAALCETHYVGLVPHFTGPISVAALVHCLGAYPGPVLMEMAGAGTVPLDYLPQQADFRKGSLWPNTRPGLGVELVTKPLTLLGEVTEKTSPIPSLRRPDGSLTNW